MLQSKHSFEPAERSRRREWNRSPLTDLFPRMPADTLEVLLDFAIDRKNFVYNLSKSKHWNARRFNHMVIAHVRHRCTNYDALLRNHSTIEGADPNSASAANNAPPGLERYEARQRIAPEAWKILKTWSPWSDSNETLEQCFQNTLLDPAQRDESWDPMDIDMDDEADFNIGPMAENPCDDPMDLS